MTLAQFLIISLLALLGFAFFVARRRETSDERALETQRAQGDEEFRKQLLHGRPE